MSLLSTSDTPTSVIVVAVPGDDGLEHAALVRSAGFQVAMASSVGGVFEAIHVCPPACILVPYLNAPEAAATMVRELKSDHVYGHLPVILLFGADHAAAMKWDEVPGDDFVVLPATAAELGARLRLCIERSGRDLDANPLTGLPGNLTIMREAEKRIAHDTPFAMGYIDIDNFKPYNDKYGFSRGDEVLRMSARVVVNAVRGLHVRGSYVGHVGGDDFIFIVPPGQAEDACKAIVGSFDQVVPNFYDPTDRRAGQIVSLDRQGTQRTFPLMGISIAVVDTSYSNVRHVGELSTRAAEVKKLAKSVTGSSFLVDRRR